MKKFTILSNNKETTIDTSTVSTKSDFMAAVSEAIRASREEISECKYCADEAMLVHESRQAVGNNACNQCIVKYVEYNK